MILRASEITVVIPHRNPFIMVGNLLTASEERIESDFQVTEGNILCEDGLFSYPGLIENIAQTCAAGFGYLARERGEETKIGFIGAINKLKTYNQPKIGDSIVTKIETLTQFNNVFLVKGSNFLNDILLVECEMKIVIAEE